MSGIDPNLYTSLAKAYAQGVLMPTTDQAGYLVKADSAGTNLEYVAVSEAFPDGIQIDEIQIDGTTLTVTAATAPHVDIVSEDDTAVSLHLRTDSASRTIAGVSAADSVLSQSVYGDSSIVFAGADPTANRWATVSATELDVAGAIVAGGTLTGTALVATTGGVTVANEQQVRSEGGSGGYYNIGYYTAANTLVLGQTTAGGVTITSNGAQVSTVVAGAGYFEWVIGGVAQMALTSSVMALKGNDLVDIASVQTSTSPRASLGFVRANRTEDVVDCVNSSGADVRLIGISAGNVIQVGHDLNNVGMDFRIASGAYRHLSAGACTYEWHISGTAAMELGGSSLDINGRYHGGVASVRGNGTIPNAGFIRAPRDPDIINTVDGSNNPIRALGVDTSDYLYVGEGTNTTGVRLQSNNGIFQFYTGGSVEVDFDDGDVTATGTGSFPGGMTGHHGYLDQGELTIASGVVTITGPRHTVDTESDAATDDLDTINGGSFDGEQVILSAADSARTVVVKHGTGNIRLDGGTDFSMTTTRLRICLEWWGSEWIELSRSSST